MEMFEEEPDTKTLATTMEGKIFGLPKFQGKWPSTNTVMFINKNWLEAVGKEVPTTFTELKDVLMAFKEQDASGNGDPDDEIPMDFKRGRKQRLVQQRLFHDKPGRLPWDQLTNWGTDPTLRKTDRLNAMQLTTVISCSWEIRN